MDIFDKLKAKAKLYFKKEGKMKNTLIIFENSLSNLGKDEASDLLEDLSFNLAYKQIHIILMKQKSFKFSFG